MAAGGQDARPASGLSWNSLDLKGSLPLGVFAFARPAATQFNFKPGDRLLMFTDGLVESKVTARVGLGEQGVLDWLNAHSNLSPQALLAQLANYVSEMTGEGVADDVTALLLVAK